jgi:hypothetical protein
MPSLQIAKDISIYPPHPLQSYFTPTCLLNFAALHYYGDRRGLDGCGLSGRVSKARGLHGRERVLPC